MFTLNSAVLLGSLAALLCFQDAAMDGTGVGSCPKLECVEPFDWHNMTGCWTMQLEWGLDHFQGKHAKCVRICYFFDYYGELHINHELVNEKNNTEVIHGKAVELNKHSGCMVAEFREKKILGKQIEFPLSVLCKQDDVVCFGYCKTVAFVKQQAFFCLTRAPQPCGEQRRVMHEMSTILMERLGWASKDLRKINQEDCCY